MQHRGLEAVGRVESEFREMPGMSLNRRQAQRLFGLDEGQAAKVLDHLVDKRFLTRTPDGSYKFKG